MKTILHNTHPTIRQMYLDPRTKILLCVTVSFVMVASDDIGIMRYVIPCIALIPLAAFVILKKYLVAAYYILMYAASIILPDFIMAHFPMVVTVLFSGIIAIFTKILPAMSMFYFFPTIKEEYSAIRDAMRLRNIGSWRNPMEMLEYRMVPLLMGLLSIGNELSASALTRGLDAPCIRTNMCPIGFHWQDMIALLFCIAIICLYILTLLFGW